MGHTEYKHYQYKIEKLEGKYDFHPQVKSDYESSVHSQFQSPQKLNNSLIQKTLMNSSLHKSPLSLRVNKVRAEHYDHLQEQQQPFYITLTPGKDGIGEQLIDIAKRASVQVSHREKSQTVKVKPSKAKLISPKARQGEVILMNDAEFEREIDYEDMDEEELPDVIATATEDDTDCQEDEPIKLRINY